MCWVQSCACAFQPGNLTGRGSEGVNPLPHVSFTVRTAFRRWCRVGVAHLVNSVQAKAVPDAHLSSGTGWRLACGFCPATGKKEEDYKFM